MKWFCFFRQILIFVVLLFVNSQCSSLYESSLGEIQPKYVKLLFDDAMSDYERFSLAVNLGTFQFHLSSMAKLDFLEENASTIKEKKIQNKIADFRRDHFVLAAIIMVKETFKMKDACRMWQIEKSLDFLVKNPTDPIAPQPTRVDECTKFDDINLGGRQNWPHGFERDLSTKHLEFFEKILSSPKSFTRKEWFSAAQIAGEGQLAHQLRMKTLNLLGRPNELKSMKQKMVQHLLLLDDLDLLERKYPLTLAIDIIDDERMALLFAKMFDSHPKSMEFSKNSFRLKISFFFVKIFAYFWEFEEKENKEEIVEKLWKLFCGILSNLSDVWDEKTREISLKALGNLLKYLQKELEFADKVRKMPENRKIVKEIFEFAEEGIGKVISDQFWTSIDDADNKKLQQFLIKQKRTEKNWHNKNDLGSLNATKNYTVCSTAKMSLADFLKMDNEEINKDFEAFELTTSYVILLQDLDDHEKHSEIELEAAIWYYRESIRELFQFADLLDDKSEEFVQNIKIVKELGQKIMQIKKLEDGRGNGKELCQLYKFAHRIAQMSVLLEGSETWREQIEQLTELHNYDLFEENLITLPNDNETGICWSEIDCNNDEMVAKFKNKMLERHKMRRIHFFCLDKLIKRFKRLQSFFCSGIGEITPVEVKENVRRLVAEAVLDALESKNPEVLHFDKHSLGMFSATFFYQMGHKSGSEAAESYEARNYVPFYLARINILERKLENDFQFGLTSRKALLEKIVKAKNEFYALMSEGLLGHLRQSHCKLFKLANFVEKCAIAMDIKVATIENWEPTECQDENVIKETLLAQRGLKKLTIFENLKQTLTAQRYQMKFQTSPGFYTRLQRFLGEETLVKKLVKDEETFIGLKVFENDKLLQVHYGNALLYDSPTMNVDGCLKADAVVVVRWMDSKEFGKGCANEMMAKRISRVWHNSIRILFAKNYDRLYDKDLSRIELPSAEIKKHRKNYANMKQYVEKAVNGKKTKTDKLIVEEWKTNLHKSIGTWIATEFAKTVEPNMDPETETDKKLFIHFEEWIQKVHYETLKRMLVEDNRFFARMEQGLNTTQTGVNNLANFLNNMENTKRILNLLGLLSDDNIPRKESTDGSPISPIIRASPAAVGKKIAKRKKAKRNKNQNKYLHSPSIAELDADEKSSENAEKFAKIPSEQLQTDEKETLWKEAESEFSATQQALSVENQPVAEQPSAIASVSGDEQKEEVEANYAKGDDDHVEAMFSATEQALSVENQPVTGQTSAIASVSGDEQKEEVEANYAKGDDDHVEAMFSATEQALSVENQPVAEQPSAIASVSGDEQKEEVEANYAKGDDDHVEAMFSATEQALSVENQPVTGQTSAIASVSENEQKKEVEDNYAEVGDDHVEAVFGGTDDSPSAQKELTPTKSGPSSETDFSEENFGEFEDIKIGDLADQNVLMTKKFEIPKLTSENDGIEKQRTPSGDEHESVNAIVHLVGVGAYANEIWHRLKAIHLMDGICYEIGIEESAVVKIEREWAQIKGLKLMAKSQWTELERHLHRMLQQLLGLMDKMPFSADGGDAGEEIREIKNELHLRNLALLLADSSNASQMFWAQTNSMIELLFTQRDSIKNRLNGFIDVVIKANSQLKIDTKLYEQYRNNKNSTKFIGHQMAINFVPNQLDHISALWQPIGFGESRFKRSDIDIVVNEVQKANKYLILDTEKRQTIENVMEQLREIVGNWASEVNFQFSVEYLLRPGKDEKLQSICLMPKSFDVLLSFLGADFYCDFSEREKCRGQSLYCKLCNNANVLTLRKIKKDQFFPISQLQFSFKSVQITILAIIVPGLSHFWPDEPFNGQQIDKISKKFGCEIENLIRADHFFDEGQFRSSQFSNNQTMELLTNSLTYAEPKKAAQIKGQLSMFERFNKMLENDRQFAHSQRESVKDLVAMLKAFANFGKHLKILEFISDKSDTIISGDLLHRFGITLAYLELWTKANHLNDGKMGYLDIEMLSIMVAKTFLLYPNASVPLLIERFFVTYSTWKWPLPIQLAEVDFDREAEFLSWTPGREWFTKRQSSPRTLLKLIRAELIMAIITPTFPEQNLAQNANLSALKCLQNHMIKALAIIRNDAAQNALIGPLESKKFTNMYEHFIVVTCTALQYQIENFSDFVGKRLGFAMCLLTTGSLSGKAMRRLRSPRRLIARKFG
uniref:polynucleotide adenylyltransferase n=1 Tax=Globodera rostochiensis TaxID=31243 RepID=A0A914I268_GLORO